MAVFHGGGPLSNLALFGGTYRPGLLRPALGAALPVGRARGARVAAAAARRVAAARARTRRLARTGRLEAARAGQRRRAGSGRAGAGACTSSRRCSARRRPSSPTLRGRIALVGTLLVGGLYLARQLHILRRRRGHAAGARRALPGAGREQRRRDRRAGSGGTLRLPERVERARHGLPPGRARRPLAARARRPGRPRRARARVRGDHRASARRARRASSATGIATARLRHGAVDAVNQLDDPAVGGVVLHLRDVTEQRRAEAGARAVAVAARGDARVDRRRDPGDRPRRPHRALQPEVRHDVARAARGAGRRATTRAPSGLVLDQLQDPGRLPRQGAQALRRARGRELRHAALPRRPRLRALLAAAAAGGRGGGPRLELPRRLRARPRRGGDGAAGRDHRGHARLRRHLRRRSATRCTSTAPAAAWSASRDEEPLAGPPHRRSSTRAAAAARLLEEAIPTALREGVWSGENLLRHEDGREIPVLQVVLAHRSPAGRSSSSRRSRATSRSASRPSRSCAAATPWPRSARSSPASRTRSRNPLFGISSTLDAFEARFAGQDDHRQYVRVLREQLDRLTRLMNDLLEYAKPTRLELGSRAASRTSSPTPSTPAPRSREQRRGRDRHPPRARPAPAAAWTSGGSAQVFRNLLENAVQHSPGARPRPPRGAPRPQRARAAPGSSAPSRTTAPASSARTCRTCSSPSSPAGTAAPASACRSCTGSSPTTAAPSWPPTAPQRRRPLHARGCPSRRRGGAA